MLQTLIQEATLESNLMNTGRELDKSLALGLSRKDILQQNFEARSYLAV